MTTFERLMQDEDFKKKFREGYKKFSLSENEKFVKSRFNFSRRELLALGHDKINQLFEIVKDWDFHGNIFYEYYERPIKDYTKSLIDVLIENDNLKLPDIIKHIKDVFDESEARTKRIFERRDAEWKTEAKSPEEQEYNLFCNLLYIADEE